MNEEKSKYPQISDIEKELKRERYRQRYKVSLKNTVFTLVTVAAIAVLVATLWLPVLQIYGGSMSPTLEDGQIVVSTTVNKLESGDIIAFYYNNKVLVKRVIAGAGQWVNIDADGNVFINNAYLNEPYIAKKALGNTDIEYPYQVPEGKIFVMGDERSTSIDSRTSTVGCIDREQIIGKIVFRVWPMNNFGSVG